MTLEILTAPRLAEGTTASDVAAEWFARAHRSAVVTPRKDEAPYRTIRIPEDEFRALCNRVSDPDGDPLAIVFAQTDFAPDAPLEATESPA